MGNVIMKAQQITYGASNVEKALDDLKAPELIELNKRMDAIDAWKANVHEETYTGSELTINNALALPARSLITSINAIQDLHGYGHPWAGGAGKNKLNLDGYVLTVPTSNTATIDVATVAVESGKTYTVSCNQKNTLASNTRNTLYVDTNGTKTFENTSENYHLSSGRHTLTFTASITGDIKVGMWCHTLSAETKYDEFMLEEGSTATSFAPYSNICPISGRTEAVITRSDGDEISEDFTIQLGQTVYGADINWDTGVMTVNRVLEEFNWDEGSNATVLGNYTRKQFKTQSIAVYPSTENIPQISDIAPYKAAYSEQSLHFYMNDDNPLITFNCNVILPTDTDITTFTVSYELATPTTIQLTPTQLQMLKGYNHITVASGYATIELKALVLGGDN